MKFGKRSSLVVLGIGVVSLFSVACSTLKKWLPAASPKASERVLKTQRVLKKAWVRALPEVANEGFRKVQRAQPLLVRIKGREMLIVANALDGLSAYDPERGNLLWRSHFEQGVEVAPSLFEETLYVGDLSGQFWAVDAETGEKLWSFQTQSEHLSEALVTEGRVYFLSGANTLFALERVTGRRVWSHSRQDSSTSSIRAGSRPVLVGEFLIAGFSDGSLVSLDAARGVVKWEQSLNKGVRFRDLDSDILVSNQQVFVMGFDDAIYSLKANTGELIWKSDLGGWGSPLLVDGKLCFASTRFSVACVDSSNGKQIWSRKLDTGVASSPSRVGAEWLAYGESQGALKIVRLSDGQEVADFAPGMGLLSPALVRLEAESDRYWLYFISGDANLYALRFQEEPPSAFSFLR